MITTGELLRSDHVDTSFDLDDKSADTKVKTAVAWLERNGFMERNQNANQVFQGKPLFSTLEEALTRLDQLQLSPHKRIQWELIIRALINADPDDGLSADMLAEQIGREVKDDKLRNTIDTTLVMGILNQMGDAGLVSNGLLMTAFLRPKGRNNARETLRKLCQLERKMVMVLQEEYPDDHLTQPVPLDLRQLNQRLQDQQLEYSNPDLLRNLLKSLADDGKGLAGSKGSLEFQYIYKDHYSIKLCRSWKNLSTVMERRHVLSQRILDALYAAVKPSESSSQSEVQIEFSLEALRDAISNDMTLEVTPDKVLPAIERGLLFLHEQNAIILQQGLAVFRQAMTLRMNSEAKGRRYTKGDYDPLSRHYQARITQVHVMNEYARLGKENMVAALKLVRDYFEQDDVVFLKSYFQGRKKRFCCKIASYRQKPISQTQLSCQGIEVFPVIGGFGFVILTFADHMTQLHTFDGSASRLETLKSQHGSNSPLDAPMVLFNQVIEVFDLADLNLRIPSFLKLFVQIFQGCRVGTTQQDPDNSSCNANTNEQPGE